MLLCYNNFKKYLVKKQKGNLKMKKFLIAILIGATMLSCGKKEQRKVNESGMQEAVQKNLKKGYVIKVYDGDTVTLADKTRIRLYGIDAPEKKQKGGMFSQQNLAKKILNREIKYEPVSVDRYGRVVGKIYAGGEYINRYMIESGSAWYYAEYAKDAKDLAEAFENARSKRIGIFSEKNIEEPWKYRREAKQKPSGSFARRK